MNVRIVNGFFQKGTHTARVLSPKTIYPRETILFSDGLYIAAEDLCFSFVRNDDPNPEEEVYSELQWLTPSEIRTYGAIMLSVDRERGYSAFYPYPISITLECEPGPDLISWVSEFVKPLLVNALLKPDVRDPGKVVTYANPYRSHSDIPMPPIVGGPSYEFQHNVVDVELARSLFEKIVPNDDLVIRGIGTYIKAAMLQRHHQFFEEA